MTATVPVPLPDAPRSVQRVCDSADGTFIAFGPDVNLPKVLGWVRSVTQPTLWDAPNHANGGQA